MSLQVLWSKRNFAHYFIKYSDKNNSLSEPSVKQMCLSPPVSPLAPNCRSITIMCLWNIQMHKANKRTHLTWTFQRFAQANSLYVLYMNVNGRSIKYGTDLMNSVSAVYGGQLQDTICCPNYCFITWIHSYDLLIYTNKLKLIPSSNETIEMSIYFKCSDFSSCRFYTIHYIWLEQSNALPMTWNSCIFAVTFNSFFILDWWRF